MRGRSEGREEEGEDDEEEEEYGGRAISISARP